jgi:hypothetical protein
VNKSKDIFFDWSHSIKEVKQTTTNKHLTNRNSMIKMAKSATLNHCVFSVVLFSLLRSVICDDNMGEWSDSRTKKIIYCVLFRFLSFEASKKKKIPRFIDLLREQNKLCFSLKACHLIGSQKYHTKITIIIFPLNFKSQHPKTIFWTVKYTEIFITNWNYDFCEL